jgi:thymidylate kinase
MENQIGENYPVKSITASFLPILSQGKKTIIVEGFNKEGKSTLAQALSEALHMDSIQFPLKLPEYKDTASYAKVMLDIRDRLEGKIVERYGLTLVTYYNILHIEDMAEDLLKFMRDNAVVITSTMFWNTVQFALRD